MAIGEGQIKTIIKGLLFKPVATLEIRGVTVGEGGHI